MNWIPAVPDAMRAPLLSTLLLTLRIGPVFFLTPALALLPMPAIAKALLVVALAAALANGLPSGPDVVPAQADIGWLIGASANELLLGGTLAFGVVAAFAAVSLAGRLLDTQVGFGLGQVLDPAAQRHVPPITMALELMAGLVFLLLNGHHALIRGIALSLKRMPLGAAWPAEVALPVLAKQTSSLFSLGFQLAAPVVASLLLVELVLAVAARALPQMNMFVTGLPLKVIVGMGALAFGIMGMGEALLRLFESMFSGWTALLSTPSTERAIR